FVCLSARESLAYASWISTDRTVQIGSYKFGFADWEPGSWGHRSPSWTTMYLGPFGEQQVEFSATQGTFYVGVSFMLLVFATVTLYFWFRWRAKPNAKEK